VKVASDIKASHVNTGTAIDPSGLDHRTKKRSAFRLPKLTASRERSESTAVGGLALAARLAKRLELPKLINSSLDLLRRRRPYHESDHVMTHVLNLYAGGSAIEDIADLQGDQAVRRILGTPRIPDPTTAGDFLRRFEQSDVRLLDEAIDEAQRNAWKAIHGRKKQKLGVVDLDSHVKHIYGSKKKGADFTYKGGYGFHPLVLSLAGTQEILRIVNRPGNKVSADEAEKHLGSVAPMLKERFRRVIVRGDSAFGKQALFNECHKHGFYFAMVSASQTNFDSIAEDVPEKNWRPFRDAPRRTRKQKKAARKRGRNLRRKKARARGKHDLQLCRQWIAEVAYKPARSERTYRLIIRRQKIQESKQGELFVSWRYMYAISNLPRSYSAETVTDLTYQRCDQENIIEQLQNGIAGMRMPTGDFLANSAFLNCARLAQNLKSWLAQLVLPEESVRWEWKRFRKAFIYVTARVTLSGRRTVVRFSDATRFSADLEAALVRLQE
jgi:hypothetical protein